LLLRAQRVSRRPAAGRRIEPDSRALADFFQWFFEKAKEPRR